MYSEWYKYVYNKIKMKKLPILLIFYWLIVQIYSVAMLFDGIPSAPSPSHIYNIMEKSDNNKLESQISSKLEVLLLNETTKGVSASDSQQQLSGRHVPVVKQPKEQELQQMEIKVDDQKQSVTAGEDKASLNLVPIEDSSSNGTETQSSEEYPEDNEDLKDEIVDSVPMEPTPLADSDFVTEDPSQVPQTDGAEEVEAVAETEKVNATVPEEHPIPVFSEWAKQMEKAEKEQEQDVANASTNKNKTSDRPRSSSTKIRAKNYASPDCGAKIIAANQESDNVGHVLSSSKDEYLISICTSRIWFVVELCEPIQAEKVELANFELFSSSPKEFSVSVSNRYPTRDWSNVGQFVAKDERTIQNFDLDPKLFGKFVRVDIHSHYNKEHFCPVSLFRVQGTSEFEAFETADLKVPLEDYEDEDGDGESGGKKDATKQDNNLFKSASDAVLSMVKKAAQVLTKGEDKGMDGTMEHEKKGVADTDCASLSHVVACEKCQEKVTNDVTNLVSCQKSLLERLWQWDLMQEIVYMTDTCAEIMGIDLRRVDEAKSNLRDLRRDFVAKLFPESYLIAMCNVAAQKEKLLEKVNVKIDSSTGNEDQLGETVVNNLTIDEPGLMENIPKKVDGPFHNDNHLVFDSPPKGMIKEEDKVVINLEEEKKAETPEAHVIKGEGSPSTTPEPSEIPTQVDPPPEAEEVKPTKDEEPPKEIPQAVTPTQPPPPPPIAQVDSWRNGETGLELNVDSGVQKVHGESVFLRLSNRIKALERNMSLSSQYLEELSRRYKKQVEELQQSFAKAILSFEETGKQTVDEKQKLVAENVRLRRDIEDVLDNFMAWKSILFYLCIFVCIQIVLFVMLLLLYIKNRLRDRRREKRREEEEKQLKYLENQRMSVTDDKAGRRNSTEGISVSSRSTTSLSDGKKRPSEEALQIVGTYSELLIESPQEGQPLPVGVSVSAGGHEKKKKNKSGRNRKSSLPNQVYQSTAASATTTTEKRKGDTPTSSGGGGGKLMHSNSVNGYPGMKRTGGDVEEDLSPPAVDAILLEENDEFYLPGSDLSYVEFVAEGGETNSIASVDQKKSSRRLSSPAFLKTALSKSVRRGGKKRELLQNTDEDVQSTTSNSSWDWLRRSSSSSQAKSEQQINGSRSRVANGSVSLSSQDSGDPVEVGVAAEGADGVEPSPKKTTSTKFRKIFKKVF